MRIEVTVDDKIPLDIEDMMGNIEITDESGGLIRGSSVWVEHWLAALKEGATALSQGRAEYLALIATESGKFVFRACEGGFTITYSESQIFATNLDEFHFTLRSAIRQVMQTFGPNYRFGLYSDWRQLQEYARE